MGFVVFMCVVRDSDLTVLRSSVKIICDITYQYVFISSGIRADVLCRGVERPAARAHFLLGSSSWPRPLARRRADMGSASFLAGVAVP